MLPERQTEHSITEYNRKKNIRGKKASDLLRMSQAVNADYKGSGYTRGHINPNGHHVTQDSRKATFTLTNVAPMTKELNNNIWNRYENEMIKIAKTCSSMYVVTGVVPSKSKWIGQKRVNIPSHVWSAYCCTGANERPIKSGGGIGANGNLKKPIELIQMPEFQNKLTKLLNIKRNIDIFHSGCKHE
ncbi:nuclease EXOG, mitochondrial-like [Xenopus tropicalis]|nr:nuclease EXOG, mitochondrial-like [Xenopus tropicalis]